MVLGPVIYFAMETVWPIPFHRAMDRALLISALGRWGLFWSRISLEDALAVESAARGSNCCWGYFIAAVSMQAMIGAHLALAGFSSAHLDAGAAWGRVLLAVVAALLAPRWRRRVFRGFLQRELVQGLGWRAGWLLAAAIYMLAHFLKVPVELDHEPVHWWSGATALGAAFSQLGHGFLVAGNLGKALNLFLVGLILGGIFLRAGSLWLNAGLHGGWIFGLLIFTGFTRPHTLEYSIVDALPGGPEQSRTVIIDEPTNPRFTEHFGGDILSSLATTVVLVLLGLWIWRFYRHPSILPDELGRMRAEPGVSAGRRARRRSRCGSRRRFAGNAAILIPGWRGMRAAFVCAPLRGAEVAFRMGAGGLPNGGAGARGDHRIQVSRPVLPSGAAGRMADGGLRSITPGRRVGCVGAGAALSSAAPGTGI